VPQPPTPVIEHLKEYINPNKLLIDPLKGHVFQDAGGRVFAYANDFDARFNAAQVFAKANPNTPVWVQADTPVLHQGKLHSWVFEVRNTFGKGVQSFIPPDGPALSQIDAGNPDTFTKQFDK
jgi:hypothetical protein